jgi:muramidase (phage lysozyme)
VRSPRVAKRIGRRRLIVGGIAAFILLSLLRHLPQKKSPSDPAFGSNFPPLVMQGGDPYIRALMRTISASEANDSRPYSILYGGDRISDLSRHPERCITIVSGPNKGNCSTAAGRYQMINTTWYALAPRYHPQPSGFLLWKSYSFEARYQDKVVYAWLKDSQEWGTDIAELLRQGKLNRVLKLLSGTWTSLGYGIEDNVMTSSLPKVYQKMLQEELQAKTDLSSPADEQMFARDLDF